MNKMSTTKDYSHTTGINYMICECGVDFEDVEELREHLQNNHIVKEELAESCDEDDGFYILDIEQKNNDIKQENDEPFIKSEVLLEQDISSTALLEQDISSTENINEITIAPADIKYEVKNDPNDTGIVRNSMSECCEIETAINEIQTHDARNDNEHIAFNNSTNEYRVIQLIPNNQERVQVRINGKLVICRRVNSVNFANEIASEVVIPDALNFINAVNEEEVVTEEIPFNELIQEHANTDYGHLKFCEICQEVFVDDKLYKAHCKKIHNKKILNERPKKKLCPKKSQCDVCGRVCASKASLRTHMSIHNGLKPFECLTCGKHFAFKIRLQVHNRIHTDERPYQCQLCPKAFRNKAAINRHHRVHTGARPYGCPECGKTFTQSNSMKWHVRTVHLKEPWPYKSKKRRQAEMERKARIMYKNSGMARSSESD